MPLSTYAELQASIGTWLDRDDLTAAIPDCIMMAEARLNDRLRLAPMEVAMLLTPGTAEMAAGAILIDPDTGAILINEETGAILTAESGGLTISSVELPSDFLELRQVLAGTGTPRVLQLASPNWAGEIYAGRSGISDVYTLVGNTLSLHPGSSAQLTLTYYRRIPALSDAAPTNWLLTKYPQMYLYAALLEAVPLLYDDTRSAVWLAYLDQSIKDAEKADAGRRWSNAAIRLRGPMP